MKAVVTPSSTIPTEMKTLITKQGITIIYDLSDEEDIIQKTPNVDNIQKTPNDDIIQKTPNDDIIQKTSNEKNKLNLSNRTATFEKSVMDDTLPLISSTKFPISKETFDILLEHVLKTLTGQTNLINQFGRSQVVKDKSGSNLNVINGEISSATAFEMLQSAHSGTSDNLLEIGCSYGKVCLIAALCFGMTAVGVEIQEVFIHHSHYCYHHYHHSSLPSLSLLLSSLSPLSPLSLSPLL